MDLYDAVSIILGLICFLIVFENSYKAMERIAEMPPPLAYFLNLIMYAAVVYSIYRLTLDVQIGCG